ncbi:LysR family transcriptional regulator [Reinekea sp. G2M2-21]|uniref:helix-turn-helix domain-containing protein n=1 Tax=Reinekea sp. G2M2-21 TaxID=2788942 RepID=UPI0018AA0611|nr:LysR family transcriptional regulator [Reinekea sp. G2M2-21]
MSNLASDLNLYRVLHTIYVSGNLTKAGQALGVTQPAVSNALSRLRKLYDDPLFVRSGTRMRPTYKTEQIIPQVIIALDLLSSTMQKPNTPDNQANLYSTSNYSA